MSTRKDNLHLISAVFDPPNLDSNLDHITAREETVTVNPSLVYGYCPEHLLFTKFDKMLEDGFKNHREASYYCEHLGVILYYLNSVCRSQAGYSAFVFIQQRILAEAKLLLTGTKLSAKSISYEMGFDNPANFNRFFKKHVGMTPLAYKRLSRSPT